MATIDASTLPAGYLKIGDQEFGEDVPARCVVTITIKGKRKLDKKAVDGKSDGTTTDKGREPGELDVELQWNGWDADADAAVEAALFQIHPRGPNGGQPLQVAFKRSSALGADNVVIEDIEGPNDKPGTSLVTAKIKAATWTKPTQTTGPGAAGTPTTVVKNFGGIPGNTVTFPGKVGTEGGAPPTVTP